MRLYYCPACARVYYLPKEVDYLCRRNHVPSASADGRPRRLVISEKSESNKPPWPVPQLSEEREILTQELTESWLTECQHPEDSEFGDVRRHFGFGAPGGRHLTKEQVLEKYASVALKRCFVWG